MLKQGSQYSDYAWKCKPPCKGISLQSDVPEYRYLFYKDVIKNIIANYTTSINASKTTALVTSELEKAISELNEVKTILDEAKESYIKYLDEIFGKGYGEECDYSCRARQNGYEIVLIDNLYVYHKRHASFGEKNREKLFSHNKLILESRWDNFLNNFFKQTNWKNPIAKIKQDLFAKKIWLISYYYQPEETFLKFCDFKIFRIKKET